MTEVNKSEFFKDFNLLEVPLKESNLIEASAGTGKTFSIAIMVLRLLIEQEKPIDEILMVTFTKAAVAELQERIRLFVRKAERCARGEEINHSQIEEVIVRSSSKKDLQKIQKLLAEARVNLDELSVMTIHGFCQQSLNEFAFETDQLFSAELLEDLSPLLEAEVHDFWRKNITTIQTDLLEIIINKGFDQNQIIQVARGQLAGKKYLFFEEGKEYTFGSQEQRRYLDRILPFKKNVDDYQEELLQYIATQEEGLKVCCEGIKSAKKAKNEMIHLLNNQNYTEFIDYLSKNKETNKYPHQHFSEIIEKIEEKEGLKGVYEEAVQNCINDLYAFALQEICRGLLQHKTAKNLMSFDDMIERMAVALNDKKGGRLAQKLREKYKAVFIDEFQDTDRQQYTIFDTAFHSKEITLFYIGDPKQSIYGWRKADIATYFEARNKVEHCYTMNTNFRSSPALVSSLNHFFKPENDFDTFYFDNVLDQITYNQVEAADTTKGDCFQKPKGSEAPIIITKLKNKKEITEETANRIWELLTHPDYRIVNDHAPEGRSIRPSDMGVLTRNKADGEMIKTKLSSLNIPAVTISDKNVLTTAEAKELVYVLEAILTPNRSQINKALLTLFTRWRREDILSLSTEELVLQFKRYQESWGSNGIYAALRKWMSDFNIQHRLLVEHTEEGERTLTNLYHLLEILYQTESRRHFSPLEITGWLKRNYQNNENNPGKTEQRIESDEDAVKITTIHKSKGLEYNIVIAPFLDFTYSKIHKTISYRNQDGSYITAHRDQLDEATLALHKRQVEQENRRLVYVALTRAVYQCFIFKSSMTKSTLAAFYEKIRPDGVWIENGSRVDTSLLKRYHPTQAKEQKQLTLPNHPMRGNSWWRMSYSSLSLHPNVSPKAAYTKSEESYDRFVFRELQKGARTGDLLHHILEGLPFNRPKEWENIIHEAVKRSLPAAPKAFEKQLLALFYHVLDTDIPLGEEHLKLSSLSARQRLPEMEFDFSTEAFHPADLEQLLPEGIRVKAFPLSEGAVTGFIDLFFEYNGKYYILDWKSNYLGPELSDYNQENVARAMTESNYHLQYLLYTYAMQRYLHSRLGEGFDYERDFGGVIYLFLRGMRNGKNTGIFYTLPDREKLREIEKIMQQS